MFLNLEKVRAQLLKGDNSCLQFIFDQHGQYCINRIQLKYNSNPEDAEDIFTDAMLSFRENILSGQIQVLTNVRGYLLRTCINKYKEKQAKELRLKKHLGELKYRWYEDEYVADELLLNLNRESFSKLSDQCRIILKYFYVERYSMAEIAGKLGLANANTVKVSKARCYKKWNELIEELKNNKDGIN